MACEERCLGALGKGAGGEQGAGGHRGKTVESGVHGVPSKRLWYRPYSITKSRKVIRDRLESAAEKPNDRYRQLCASCTRQNRNAANQNDELAPQH